MSHFTTAVSLSGVATVNHEVEVHCSHSKIFESIPCMYSVACALLVRVWGFYTLIPTIWMQLIIAALMTGERNGKNPRPSCLSPSQDSAERGFVWSRLEHLSLYVNT